MPTGLIELGEYNGIRIEAREDSFINATQMCKAAKKKWAKYKENQSTHEFFEALSQELQCPISDIVISQVGGDRSGTWVHRRIAIHLAQWCNAKFAVWVTGQIERIIDGRQVAHREHAEASFYEALFNKLVEGQNQLIQGHLDSSKRINRIEDDVSQVKDDVRAIRSEISHKRKNFSNSAKNAAIACLQEYSRNGVVCCPCCDRPTNEVEFHHWQQKGGNNPRIMIPLHPDCHKEAAVSHDWHVKKQPRYEIFQERCLPFFRRVGVIQDKPERIEIQPWLFNESAGE